MTIKTQPRDSTNAIFDVLSHPRRRYALSYLRDADDDVAELAELADGVTTREADREGDGQETVVTALHHVHLPKLAESELIDYDVRSKTVRYHGRPEFDQTADFAVEVAGGYS